MGLPMSYRSGWLASTAGGVTVGGSAGGAVGPTAVTAGSVGAPATLHASKSIPATTGRMNRPVRWAFIVPPLGLARVRRLKPAPPHSRDPASTG
jgi:hypothetical protein